jgi:hypothetical protein
MIIDQSIASALHRSFSLQLTLADMATSISSSDAFDLYDLRVEVICPPGKKIYCGAKDGDYFELRGEMIYLPPGQGFSLYSLCMLSDNFMLG